MPVSLRFLALPIALALAVPVIAEDHGHDHDEHLASLGEVSVVHAWTRASAQGADAVVFFEVENEGQPVVLSGGEFEKAASVEIVGASLGTDGKVAYNPVGTFTIPHGDFDFDPNGLGLRLNGLTEALEQGGHFHMHLLIGEGELEISVEVEAADATQHSHAGHSH